MSIKTLIPSLNGIRAVSVLLVAAAHCGWGHVVPGGLGVTAFFFLSGFLITTLLRREFTTSGSIDFRKFYFRRLIRLSPPFLITLALAAALTAAGLTSGAVTAWGLLAQVFYFSNYLQIFFDVNSLIPGGTGIFWSLAVEEHFYLVYPALLLFCLRARAARTPVVLLVLACLAVLAWRWHLASQPGFHPDRTYFGTDTRIDSMLWGCLLAFTWTAPRFQAWTTSRRHNLLISLVLGALLLLTTLVMRGDFFRETFRYTLQGIALMLIFSHLLCVRHGLLHRVLNSRVLDLLGRQSYAFYLVHFILVDFLSTQALLTQSLWVRFVAVVAVAWLYAAVMERLVERPMQALRNKLHIEADTAPPVEPKIMESTLEKQI